MCSATRRCPADKHPSPEKRARKNARRREARAAKKKAAMVASKVEESLKSSPKAEEVTVQLNTAAPDEAKVSVKKGGRKKKQTEVTAMEAPEESVMKVTEIETPELSEAELHERALAVTSEFMDRTDTFNDMEFKDLPEKVIEDGMTEEAWNQLQAERREIEQAHEAERSLAAAHELLEDDELDEYVGQDYDSLEGLMKDRGISREAWDQVNAEQQERSDAIDARHEAERAEEVTQDYLANHMDEMDKEYEDLPDYAKKDGVTEEAWNKAAELARAERDAIRAENAEEVTNDYLANHMEDMDKEYNDLPDYAKKDGVTEEAWNKAAGDARAERDAIRAEEAEEATQDYLEHHKDDIDTSYDDLPAYAKKDGVTREAWEKATAEARANRVVQSQQTLDEYLDSYTGDIDTSYDALPSYVKNSGVTRETWENLQAEHNAAQKAHDEERSLKAAREFLDYDEMDEYVGESYDNLEQVLRNEGITREAWEQVNAEQQEHSAAIDARNEAERISREADEAVGRAQEYLNDNMHRVDTDYDDLPDYVVEQGITREAWDMTTAQTKARRDERAEEVANDLAYDEYNNFSGISYDYLPEEYKSELTPEIWERVNAEKVENETKQRYERGMESSRNFIEDWGDPRDVKFEQLDTLNPEHNITPEAWEDAVNEWKRDHNLEDEDDGGYDYY